MAHAVRDAETVSIVLTHGHSDHASAAPLLAADVAAEVWGPPALDIVDRPLEDEDVVSTDEGDLIALFTPGHAPGHLSFHWPDRRALFAGDLLLGTGDTTWVGEYPGCVQDYLDSLERLRGLELEVIYPAHGPPLDAPDDAIDRFERHRRERISQMGETLAKHPGASIEDLLDSVYGRELPELARRAASMSLGALKEHVEAAAGYSRT